MGIKIWKLPRHKSWQKFGSLAASCRSRGVPQVLDFLPTELDKETVRSLFCYVTTGIHQESRKYLSHLGMRLSRLWRRRFGKMNLSFYVSICLYCLRLVATNWNRMIDKLVNRGGKLTA